MKSCKIGSLTLDNPVILAPMAGVTDLPFRLLCKEQGAGLLSMEMVSAKAILYKNKNTAALMEIHPDEKPVSLQLFGSEPDIMAEAAAAIEERPFEILDINMGCPVPKVVNNHEGSALMKDPKRAAEIVTAITKRIKKPVTAKIRIGFDAEHINAVEMAKMLEGAGAAAIAVHGRTREQYYSGSANWDVIRQVKEAVSVPVIGNGDIDSPIKAKKMFDETGCDGIMIGRGAEGNPWIFSQILSYLREGTFKENIDLQERISMILRHANMLLQYKGDYIGIREMRKHVSWYTAGLPHSAKLRQRINTVESVRELEEILRELCI